MGRAPVGKITSGFAALALALTFVFPASAAAQVQVEMAPECGTEPELRERLIALCGTDALGTLTGQLRLTRGERGDFELQVSVQGRTRSLRDAACGPLFEAAAVILAIAVKPEMQDAIAPKPAPPTPPVAQPLPAVPRRRMSSEAWLEAGGVYGVVPAASASFGLGAGLWRGSLGASLSARYVLPRTSRGEDRVRVRGTELDALLTWRALPRLTLALGPDLQLLRGRGVGVARARSAWLVVAGPKLELRVRVLERARGGLDLSGFAAVPVERPRFLVDEYGTVFRPAVTQFGVNLRYALLSR